jgi:phage I-like protein
MEPVMKKTYLAMCFNLATSMIDALGEEQGANSVWLPMIPAGEVKGRDGRMWMNTEPDAIVAAFDAKLPFDIEHSTEILAPQGKEAEAVGWILALENRAGEIWAQVEWNYVGRYKITDKYYLYYSPAFHFNDQGVITAMSSAGLTNKPNFYVPALNRQEDDAMKLPKLIVDALGLAEDATPEQAVVAINSLNQEKEVALNRASMPDLNKFVPIETHTVALNRATTAETALQQIEDQKMEALVQAAIDDGKIAPANKDMFVAMCRSQGAEQFTAFVSTAPAIATNAQKKTTTTAQGEGELTADEVALCRAMNVSHESWIASRKHKPNY